MGKKELSAFIAVRKKSSKETDKIDWGKRKDDWLEYLHRLYSDIESWLDEFQADGGLSFEYPSIRLNEENIGVYECNSMKIRIAAQEVLLLPVGTVHIIGAFGRVDMMGRNGDVKLLLVPESSTGPEIKLAISVEDQVAPKQKNKESAENLVWKIATPPPTVRYIDLDGDSFSDALLEVIEG